MSKSIISNNSRLDLKNADRYSEYDDHIGIKNNLSTPNKKDLSANKVDQSPRTLEQIKTNIK